MSQSAFEYYAFISYNHKDRVWAEKLQRQLQRYRLPAALIREHPGLPKRITPVFLDQTDLVDDQGGLKQSLRKKLDASQYLIVICSPNSAAAPWVDAEVRYFIASGRKERIIPFIIDGEPHAKDPARECYPPALNQLTSEEELLGISVETHGQRGAFLRVIATLLRLKLDSVIERDAAWRRRRRIAAVAGCALTIAVAASLIWYNTPHVACYTAVSDHWQVPVGIDRLSSAQQAQRNEFYRLTTLRGRVVLTEHVNSAGELLIDQLVGDPPMMKYYYENDGKLSRTECYDELGRLQFGLKYSADLRIVDFTQADSGYAFALGAGGTSAISPENSVTETRSEIIRYVQDYDENGFLIRRMYKRDNRGSTGGTPVRDEAGAWGQAYTCNARGQILTALNLDRDGKVMLGANGAAGIVREFDESGHLISMADCDENGQVVLGSDFRKNEMTYDERGNLHTFAYLHTDGTPWHDEQGISVVRLTYDEAGFLQSRQFFDEQGNPCFVDGWCEETYICDAQGRQIREECRDAAGRLTCCDDGYAVAEITYDASGRQETVRYLDADGHPAVSRELKVFGIRSAYADNRLICVEYQDAAGNPMTGSEGFASICFTYNDAGQKSGETYLDTAGQPVRCGDGYAGQAFEYTDDNLSARRYLDEAGQPCPDKNGVATYCYTYETGLCTQVECLDAADQPTLNNKLWYRAETVFDAFGQRSAIRYYNTENKLIENDEDFAEVRYTYDTAGRIKTLALFDANGSRSQSSDYYHAYQILYGYDALGYINRKEYIKNIPEGVALYTRENDTLGNVLKESWLDAAGNPTENSDGYVRIEYDYNAQGRNTATRRYDAGGNCRETVYTYLQNGRLESMSIFDSQGEDYTVQYTYDAVGNKTEENFIGFGSVAKSYDERGNCTDARYFSPDGQPILTTDGYHHISQQFDQYGRVTETETYDTAEQRVEIDGYFREVRTYDAYGSSASLTLYAADDSFVAAYSWERDPAGTVIREYHLDENGRELMVWGRAALVNSVIPDSPAAQAGFKAGMALMRFGEWDTDLILSQPSAWRTLLAREINRLENSEKTVALAYLTDEFTGKDVDHTGLAFLEKTFPAGLIGVNFSEDDVEENSLQWILEGWHAYRDGKTAD